MQPAPRDRDPGPFSSVAFALVVLVAYADFLRVDQIRGAPWMIPVVFVGGAIHALLGVLHKQWLPADSHRATLLYTVLQTALAAALLLLSPVQGFFFLLAMPITSYAVIALEWRWSAAVTGVLFLSSVGALWINFGRGAALQNVSGYALAFMFTIVFSAVTRSALTARERAESLSTQLTAANEQLRAFANEAADVATTRERNRLAREIHDGLGHYLTTINIQLEAARTVAATDPAQARAALETAARLSREALDDVRRSVGALRADAARTPLAETLQPLGRNLGLEVSIAVHGTPRPLSAGAELALYRCAQEGLTNVRKHAGVDRASLRVDYRHPAEVSLTVADDGHGVVRGAGSGGYGLTGLRERVGLLGGTLTTGNGESGGFVLSVQLPG